MTVENTTSTITTAKPILRQRLEVCQSAIANGRETTAAASVPHGARCRSAIASVSPRAVWCVNGRMMKAGMKNNAIQANANAKKRTHRTRFEEEGEDMRIV